MTDNPIDLSPLDPTRDSRAFGRTARALAQEAVRARRRATSDPIGELARWTRPALATALVIAAAAGFVLVLVGTPRRGGPVVDRSADLAGIPPLVVEWTHTNHQPSPLEVVRVLGQRSNNQ